MKKNKMMRVASALLVAVLLTTCAISSTFAKYVTQDGASDVARVAKWGVELQVVGNLFGDTYINTIVADDDDTLTVQSVDKATDIVAPGTKNENGFTFSLKGKPEVSGTVTTTMTIQNVFLMAGTYGVMIPVDRGVVTADTFDEFTELYYKDGDNYVAATAWADVQYYTLEDKVDNATNYFPVVYNLAGNTATTGAVTADSLYVAAEAIADQLELAEGAAAADTSITYTGTKMFEANTDLADWACDGLTLTWEWAIGENTDANADTILGMIENVTEGEVVKLDGEEYVAVEEYTDYCLDTMFSIDITVEQVDELIFS